MKGGVLVNRSEASTADFSALNSSSLSSGIDPRPSAGQLDPASTCALCVPDQAAALIVADGSCPQIRQLLAAAEAPVLWLDEQQQPLQAVGQALAECRKLDQPVATLHWVSHGSPGELQLGSTRIDSAALLSSPQNLARWGVSSIALWSCSTGADQGFISVFEELTGATLWSSNQQLGRLADGSSSWSLSNTSQTKTSTGAPALPIKASQQLAWNHQLGGFSTNSPNLQSYGGNSYQEYKNDFAFAALKDDGSVITWGILQGW